MTDVAEIRENAPSVANSGSRADEMCVDLTELKPEVLRRLYSQLKQVNKYGEIIKNESQPSLPTYQNLKNLPIESTTRSREAARLFSQSWLTQSHIKTQFYLDSEKEALELILDEIWSTNGRVDQFSFLTLMKEVKVRMNDMESVSNLLQNEATSSFDIGILLSKTLLEPSVLEVVLAVLYMETLNSPLYKEILDKQTDLTYSDDEIEIDEEELNRLVDEAMTELQPEMEQRHKPCLEKLTEIEHSAEDFEKQLDELNDFVENITKQAEEEKEQFKQTVRDAPVTVIDESTPPVRELLPSRSRNRAKRLFSGGGLNEDVEVIDANSTTQKPSLSRFAPDILPPLHHGDGCLAQIGQGPFRKAVFASENQSLKQCCIRIDGDPKSCMVGPENLAYEFLPSWILVEGTRVAARPQTQKHIFLPGTIAEKASALNKMRYLVFFDDSSTTYVAPDDVRVMYVQVKLGQKLAWRDGWKLVDKDPSLRQFLERYLKAYPGWAMCTVRKHGLKRDRILVFGNNEWQSAYVWDVDCHMVQIRYPHTDKYEWLYRGSLRFREVQKKNAETSPTVGYTQRLHRGARRFTQSREALVENLLAQTPISLAGDGGRLHQRLQLAKKRTVFRRADYDETDTASSSSDESVENRSRRIEELTDERELLPHIESPVFCPHKCTFNCNKQTDISDDFYKAKSPFVTPLFQGWTRQRIDGMTSKFRRAVHKIIYVAPCGRRLRNEQDVTMYLRDTSSRLTIDMFTFDSQVHANRKMTSLVTPLMDDYSKGHEATPIPVVNARNDEKPVVIEYQARRFPANEAVQLQTTDGNFCSGCSCTDDCSDASVCECRLLTEKSIERLHLSLRPKKKITGYENRRLRTNVMSGIYECNDKCPCNKKKCFNSVVQQPLKIPLQLFKTEFKGWGLRTLVDVPMGQFICVYSGAIWTNDQANEVTDTDRDEYFADLDLIDVVLDEKEDIGVEYMDDPLADEGISTEDDNGDDAKSREQSSDNSDSDYGASGSDDDEYIERKKKLSSPPSLPEPSIDETDAASSSKTKITETSGKNDAITIMNVLNLTNPTSDALNIKKGWDMMDYLGGKERFGFTVDARTRGNIGRFLNHSCDPNVFVQNVLVDTHDLRLPWVAFFAMRRIRAGEELCWDYKYEVMDATRQKECKCESVNCRGRLM